MSGTMFEVIAEGPNKGKKFWYPSPEASSIPLRGWIPLDQSVDVPSNNNGLHCSYHRSALKLLSGDHDALSTELESMLDSRDSLFNRNCELADLCRELIDSGDRMESFLPSTGMQLDAKANWQQDRTKALALVYHPASQSMDTQASCRGESNDLSTLQRSDACQTNSPNSAMP